MRNIFTSWSLPWFVKEKNRPCQRSAATEECLVSFLFLHWPKQEVHCSGCLRKPGTVAAASELRTLLRCLVGTLTKQENSLQLQVCCLMPQVPRGIDYMLRISGGQQWLSVFTSHPLTTLKTSLCPWQQQITNSVEMLSFLFAFSPLLWVFFFFFFYWP